MKRAITSFVMILAALGLSCSFGLGQTASSPPDKVEEDWQVVIASPSPDEAGPQIKALRGVKLGFWFSLRPSFERSRPGARQGGFSLSREFVCHWRVKRWMSRGRSLRQDCRASGSSSEALDNSSQAQDHKAISCCPHR